MSKYGKTILVAALLLSPFAIMRGETPKVLRLIERDSIITVSQPQQLENRLVCAEKTEIEVVETDDQSDANQPSEQGTTVVGGYRVQIFADNNARTAKDEARAKALAIREQMPHLATYVTYEAPYWRVRVGDFRSESDAQEAAAEIKHYFPGISREVRVVRDRINK
ncbi:MAG: SPOR domain-containing protein [Muribaculaceae bacterium]|nr:SPOR domain-containing protein [Muribaculaceae bacterium]